MKRYKPFFIVLNVLLFLGLSCCTLSYELQSILNVDFPNDMAVRPDNPTQKVTDTQSYIEHGPITITSDFQLNNSGFPGNGTIDDPILIKNYSFTPENGFPLIHISGTTFYFRITNCLLNGSSNSHWGIHLDNVINGHIESNVIINNPSDGIGIYSSENISIKNNIIHHNSWNGIRLESLSNYNIIANNTAYNNDGEGVWLGSSSNNNSITNNTLYNNRNGIYLGTDGSPPPIGCHNNTIATNLIFNNFNNGIELQAESDDNIITNNTVFNNGFNGINVASSKDNKIENNTILNNSNGILFIDSHDNVIHNNSVFENIYVGIRIGEGDGTGNNYNNNISMNTIFDNSEAGIGIYSNNHHNKIYNNSIFNNGAGIGFQSNSNNNSIQENLLYSNGLGLYFSSSNYNTIQFNDFSGNSASDNSLGNVFEKNYWSDWTGTDSYSIGGSAGNRDLSPLMNPYHLSGLIITAPTIENLTLAGNVLIQWNVLDTFGHTLTYSVFYSTDDGGSWTTLASGLTTTNYTLDTTTIADGTSILLKIQAVDSIGFVAKTVSTESFLIANTPHRLSSPSITSPSQDDTLTAQIDISWIPVMDTWNHEVCYSLYYSADNGTTWIQLGTELTTTSYSWDTTIVTDGTEYLIKVNASCTDGLVVEDILEGTFNVHNEISTPTISSPKSGEILNGTITIEWSASLDPLRHSIKYTVYYSSDDGATWTQLASGLTVTSYSWDTSTVPNGFSYRIKVIAICSEGVTAEDITQPFTIQNPISTSTSSDTIPSMGYLMLLLLLVTLIVVKKWRKTKPAT
ncbi:MAG: right-handed parallel beta-helix repeat-containing protein [Candidatus Hermodarchaeota archaeon]